MHSCTHFRLRSTFLEGASERNLHNNPLKKKSTNNQPPISPPPNSSKAQGSPQSRCTRAVAHLTQHTPHTTTNAHHENSKKKNNNNKQRPIPTHPRPIQGSGVSLVKAHACSSPVNNPDVQKATRHKHTTTHAHEATANHRNTDDKHPTPTYHPRLSSVLSQGACVQ